MKDGWIPFLRGLSHRDPFLWHGIATDFHEINHRGRLDAAFWILEQPECDRATSSDFIRGFGATELFEFAAKSKDTARLNAFQEVINRYNSGDYIWFGLEPDVGGIEPTAETTARSQVAMTQYVATKRKFFGGYFGGYTKSEIEKIRIFKDVGGSGVRQRLDSS